MCLNTYILGVPNASFSRECPECNGSGKKFNENIIYYHDTFNCNCDNKCPRCGGTGKINGDNKPIRR
jgi:DnaJ-class molecular chaperone